MNTTDARCAARPILGRLSNHSNPSITGYILEADFMKFRGRGFIQTTGRSNYARLIDFVKSYTGANNTLDFFALQWRDLSQVVAADSSSNDDWDGSSRNPT